MVSGATPGPVSLWYGNTDAVELSDQALDAQLADDEVARAGRFAFPALGRRYRIGRAALRRILGAYCSKEPRRIAFSVTAQGKPFLPGGPQFNLSRSGNLFVVVASDIAAIGVDIESLRSLDDAAALALRHFSSLERSYLDSLPEPARLRGFFRAWARKEAVAKAAGDGLSLDFRSFSVPLDASEMTVPVALSPGFPHAGSWFVRPVALNQSAEAAIAGNAPFSLTEQFRFDPSLGWSADISTDD